MTCYECAVAGQSTPAVVVCLGCGVGLCTGHVFVAPRYHTRTAAINRVEVVEPRAGVARCAVCASAEEAQPLTAWRSEWGRGA